MKTVREVSRLSGVSVRTLHHYDAIGLLKPAAVTEAGYRLYDDGSLSRLQRILLLRELQFPLKDIRAMLDAPEEDRALALAQQLRLLEMQRAHIDGLIALTHDILKKGANAMDFSVFDRTAIDDYAAEVRSRWGETAAYRQSQSHSAEENHASSAGLMAIFGKFGTLRSKDPSASEAQALCAQLQQYITDHYYTCTKDILRGLGPMYTEDERFRSNIDDAGGPGTADFAARSIAVYCK